MAIFKRRCYLLIVLFIMVGIISYVTYNILYEQQKHIQHTQETIEYLLVDEHEKPAMLSITNSNDKTLFLKIAPHISSEKEVLYTIFQNGKQIECEWDNVSSLSKHKKTLPNVEDRIMIKIDDIQEGVNIYHIGCVYSPYKIDYEDDNLQRIIDDELDLTPFTIIKGNAKEHDVNKKEFTVDKSMLYFGDINKKLLSIDGDVTTEKKAIKKNLVYSIKDTERLYYFWRNSDAKKRNLRLVLLKDWEQIPWPGTNRLFIDTLANPDDVLMKEIDLKQIAPEETSQICIVAFLNPYESFWYENEDNDIKATHYGAIAFSDRIIVNNTNRR